MDDTNMLTSIPTTKIVMDAGNAKNQLESCWRASRANRGFRHPRSVQTDSVESAGQSPNRCHSMNWEHKIESGNTMAQTQSDTAKSSRKLFRRRKLIDVYPVSSDRRPDCTGGVA